MTRPLDWNQSTIEHNVKHILSHQAETREDWDDLPNEIRAGGMRGHKALMRIASFAHRGWLDLLLGMEADVYHHNLQNAWRRALESCVGPDGPGAGDRDVSHALSQVNRMNTRMSA